MQKLDSVWYSVGTCLRDSFLSLSTLIVFIWLFQKDEVTMRILFEKVLHEIEWILGKKEMEMGCYFKIRSGQVRLYPLRLF